MTNPNPDSPATPPTDETNTDEADAEAFADEWMDYKSKVDHVTDFMNSILGSPDNDEQPPAPTPPTQPRPTPVQQKQAQRQPASPPVPPTRRPDTPPEDTFWYSRKRWFRRDK